MTNLSIGKMEFVDHCQPACSRPVLNGYTNKIFQTRSKERNASLNSGGYDNNECENAARHKKKTKGSRIWNLVSRKKGTSMNTKRPQSMILFGDNMEVLEQNHKMSFMDRVRSFKKLRSASTSKNASKSKPGAITEETQEDVEQKTHYRIKKLSENQWSFRHSYAGYIEDLDSSFEDVEVNSCVLDMDTSESKWKLIVDFGLNDEDSSNDKISTRRIVASELESSQRSEPVPADIQRRQTVDVPENRKGRSSDVWSYLKGISLTSKDNSKLRDKRIEPIFQDLENRMDNSSSYLDFELRCEEEIGVGQTKRPNNMVKGTHFGGVRRFFSSVAEVARKWRASSKTFSQEEQMSNSTCGHQRQVVSSHQQLLVIANDNARVFSSTGMCPDSGIWDQQNSKSLAKKKLSPGNANAEISQEVSTSVLNSENISASEMSVLPHGSSLSDFPFSEFPDDSCAFLGMHSLAMNLLPIDDPLLHQIDHRGIGSRETWILDSWVQNNTDNLENTLRDTQGLDAASLKGQDSTKATLDATDMESAPWDYKNWCNTGSELSNKTDQSTLGLSAAAEDISPLGNTVGDAQDLANPVAEIRVPVDNEYVNDISQYSPDTEFTPVDNPDFGTILADNQIPENASHNSQNFGSNLVDSQDLANTLTNTCDSESSFLDSQNISLASSDTQSMGSILEDMYSSYISPPLSCNDVLDQEPIEVNGKTIPTSKNPEMKPHFKYREVCHPFQMSLCTTVSFNEFNSRKVRPYCCLAVFLTSCYQG